MHLIYVEFSILDISLPSCLPELRSKFDASDDKTIYDNENVQLMCNSPYNPDLSPSENFIHLPKKIIISTFLLKEKYVRTHEKAIDIHEESLNNNKSIFTSEI